MKLVYQFVELVPERLDEGVLYVCLKYKTIVHQCCCGCGREVVTTLSPTDWKLTFDGDTISLSPSVGNWAFPCRSHYWITNSRVKWSGDWSGDEIDAADARDRKAKRRHYQRLEVRNVLPTATVDVSTKESLWAKLKKRWLRF